jgi:arabinose-5-phosphate isomerase
MVIDNTACLARGKSVLITEAQAIFEIAHKLDQNFISACEILLNTQGKVIVMGMGKSGHVGRKIAATFASTGTPAFFIHPGEACHGDLGMLSAQDTLLLLSYSGETDEILTLLPTLKRLGTPMIAITGVPHSQLARVSHIALDIGVTEEACPLGLAPTASTTATLALGDALAIALLEARGFTPEDFAQSHPAGQLGRKLWVTVAHIMHTGPAIPRVTENVLLVDAIVEMSQKALGMTTIVDSLTDNHLIGIFTDGDLRRALGQGINVYETTLQTLMNRHTRTISADQLAIDALSLMETHKILALPVIDREQRLVGAFNMQDLLRARVL